MRWILAAAFLAWLAPVQAQPNEAEKLYRGFEKKLADAKAVYKVAFEFDMTSKDMQIRIKGDLFVADGNQMHLTFAGSQSGMGMPARPMVATIVSNGKQLGFKFNEGGMDETKSDPAPAHLIPYLKGYLPPAGVFLGIEVAAHPEARPEDAPNKIKLAGFKLGAKEKIGDKQAQVVEYTLDLPQQGKGSAACKLWFDVKTNMPIKRTMEFKAGTESFRLSEDYASWQIDPKLKGDEFTLPK